MPSFPTQGGSDAVWGSEVENFFSPYFDLATGLFRMSQGSAAAPLLTFNGDIDTGIFSPGPNEIGLSTGGVQRLKVDASGKATFSGQVSAVSYLGDASGMTGFGNTGGVINPGSTTIGADTDSNGVGEVAFQIKGVTQAVLANNGNLGIGVGIAPAHPLHVSISGASNFALAKLEQVAVGRHSVLAWKSALQEFVIGVKDELGFVVAEETGAFSSNSNIRFMIEKITGNVGIGITVPSALFHVSEASISNNAMARFQQNTASRHSVASFQNTSQEFVVGVNDGLGFVVAEENGAFINADNVRFMIEKTTGNVGIGTSTPNANTILDVTSTTKAFMPPRMTTTQRDAIPSPTKGMMIYNITTNVPDHYNGTTWGAV